ncbi:MAG: leucine-rich repeat protein [Agathobacter sp.]|nr:leucine-rich repeat protein [Agathobacter sp.]
MLKNKKKGFTLVELIVVIAIMVVLLAVLAPSLLRYVENSRMQRDDSAMDEVCNSVQLAMADSNTFDEVFEYSIPNNYVTYTDSSGVYGAKYTDEEFWAPDGSGQAVTITFNPDENGDYDIAKAMVNDMTLGNGSVADQRTAEGVKQCTLEEMGNQKLYSAVKKTIGTTLSEKSATYKNSSYTVFITFDLVGDMYRAEVYGEWNGTNLYEDCPASLGSGTSSYTPEGEAVVTKPTGGTTTPTFTSSDLSGGGTVSSGGNESDGTTEMVGNIIPEGGQYTTADGTVLNAGDYFPEVVTAGDVYDYGNYQYSYQRYYHVHAKTWMSGASLGISISGWGVYCKNNVESPGQILESINNKPITSMVYTFYNCRSLIDAPKIPNDVVQMQSTFSGCQNLVNAPIIPNGISHLTNTFSGCSSLINAPIIPNSVTSMDGTFSGCTSLVNAPSLPNGISNINRVFYNCTSLINAPIIPNNITSMQCTFSNCTNLSGVIEINANPNRTNSSDDYMEFFKNVDFESQNITLTGESTMLDEIGATGTNYCAECNGKCFGHTNNVIPDGAYYGNMSSGKVVLYEQMPETASDEDAYYFGDYVYYYVAQNNGWTADLATSDNAQPFVAGGVAIELTDRYQSSYGEILSSINGKPVIEIGMTFAWCSSLTVAPVIPSSVTSMKHTFWNCTSLTTIKFAGTVDQWNAITFESDWNDGVLATEVVCSDGIVSLS